MPIHIFDIDSLPSEGADNMLEALVREIGVIAFRLQLRDDLEAGVELDAEMYYEEFFKYLAGCPACPEDKQAKCKADFVRDFHEKIVPKILGLDKDSDEPIH